MKHRIRIFLTLALFLGIFYAIPANTLRLSAGTKNQGSWGDNGNGTYNNPILPGDYSDPDVIRVGEDYFAITSTFQFVPGITVLHSKDMVNWEILGGAVKDLTRISPRYNYDKMQGYGKIIWAPCITYQESTGTFFIHFCTPDEGMFVTTTTREGIWDSAWTDLERVTYADDKNAPGGGWDDCGVLWDSDGQGYLVANHFAGGYQNYLFRLSQDGKTLEDHGVRIHYQNDGLLEGRGEGGTEAFKLFKKDGYYYFLHNGVVDSGRELFFLRAKHIYGDRPDGGAGSFEQPGSYEHSQHGVVEWGYHEWCQGNIIDTPDSYKGEKKWYFFTHQGGGMPGIGRPACLVPVTWGADGFPAAEGYKEQWENIPKPMPESMPVRPQASDDFSGSRLNPQWMWSFQPKEGMWSLSERPGYLRLYGFQPIGKDRLDQAGNSLLQRSYATEANLVKTSMDISHMAEGQNAGLMHASSDVYGAIGVRMEGGRKYLCSYVSGGKVERVAEIPQEVSAVYLKSQWGIHMDSTFFYSFDGKNFIPAGKYNLQWKSYRGDSVGFFCYNNERESGYVDIDSFTYDMDVQEKAPLILGVDDGGVYEGRVKPIIPRGNITVNGKPVKRVSITQPGNYTIRVEENGKWNEVSFQVKNLPTPSLKFHYDFNGNVGDTESVSLSDGKLGSLGSQPTPSYGQGLGDLALRLDGIYGLKVGSLKGRSFTVSMWLKMSSENIGSCNSVLFGNRDNGSKSQENWISARFDAGYPFVWSNFGGSRHDLARDSISYAPDKWIHFVFSNYEGEVTTYIDGTEVANAMDTSPLAENVDFYVGGTFWNDAFYGWLDDLKIYEGAVSQEEVERLFLEKAPAANKAAKTDASNIAVSLEEALGNLSGGTLSLFGDARLEGKKVGAVAIQLPAATLTLAGDTQIGTLDNRSGGTVALAKGFCGSASIQILDCRDGAVIAKVEEGAGIEGISVKGMPEGRKLELEGDCLVIRDIQPEPIEPIKVEKIVLSRNQANLWIGDKISLKASVSPKDAANQAVTWSSSNEKVAKVDAKGQVTALSAGTATVRAAAADGAGAEGTCKVTVKAHMVKKITLKSNYKTVAAGKKAKITATVATTGKTAKKALAFSTSNRKYATVSAKGVVSTQKAGAGKTVTITATAKDGSKKKASIKIKIVKDAVKKITLSCKKKTVAAGKKITVKAAVKATGKKANKTLAFCTSNKKYATVTSKGVVTAKKAGKGKRVAITAVSTDGTNRKAVIKLKIK